MPQTVPSEYYGQYCCQSPASLYLPDIFNQGLLTCHPLWFIFNDSFHLNPTYRQIQEHILFYPLSTASTLLLSSWNKKWKLSPDYFVNVRLLSTCLLWRKGDGLHESGRACFSPGLYISTIPTHSKSHKKENIWLCSALHRWTSQVAQW